MSYQRCLTIFFVAVAMTCSAFAESPPKYGTVQVHVFRPKTGVFENTVIQLGSKEGQALIIGTCAAFGGDCSKPAAAFGVASKILRSQRRGNEEWKEVFAPRGHILCKVQITETRHDSGTTFSGTYKADASGMQFYIDVPSKVSKSKGIDYKVHLMFVRKKDRKAYACAAPGSSAFICPQDWCCNPRPINRLGVCKKY